MLGVKDPLMVKLKEFYQLTWCENQILFHNMAGLLDRLHNAGIQTMILKGAALLLLIIKILDFDRCSILMYLFIRHRLQQHSIC